MDKWGERIKEIEIIMMDTNQIPWKQRKYTKYSGFSKLIIDIVMKLVPLGKMVLNCHKDRKRETQFTWHLSDISVSLRFALVRSFKGLLLPLLSAVETLGSSERDEKERSRKQQMLSMIDERRSTSNAEKHKAALKSDPVCTWGWNCSTFSLQFYFQFQMSFVRNGMPFAPSYIILTKQHGSGSRSLCRILLLKPRCSRQ